MIFVTAALDQIETNNASNLRASVRISRDIDSSEARAPQFGPRADAGLERAVGEAPTTDLYFFATFSQCGGDGMCVDIFHTVALACCCREDHGVL